MVLCLLSNPISPAVVDAARLPAGTSALRAGDCPAPSRQVGQCTVIQLAQRCSHRKNGNLLQ